MNQNCEFHSKILFVLYIIHYVIVWEQDVHNKEVDRVRIINFKKYHFYLRLQNTKTSFIYNGGKSVTGKYIFSLHEILISILFQGLLYLDERNSQKDLHQTQANF